MNIYIAFLVLPILAPAASEGWSIVPSLQDMFIEQEESITNFFEEQGNKMRKKIESNYEDAVKVQESIDNYMAEQQKKITSEFNEFVDTMKEGGRKIADTWSFVPNEDPATILENPDVTLTVPGIITRHGYTCETHTVMSQGYILNIHRIPHSKYSMHVPKRTVLLQHGLFASSADWILNGPDRGLAYVLADAGYDVWMANIRGNRYSKEHAWLKTDSKSYWGFSWHDIALYDEPAVIDYILKLKGTGAKLSYIGHSMGTTILFAMLSLRPEYNELLSVGLALAPVVFLSDIKSPLKSLAPAADELASLDMLHGSYEFIPKASMLGKFSESCDLTRAHSMMCKNITFYICGYNEKQFNTSLLPVFNAHLGTGTSWKTAVHFSQEIENEGRFQYFDYGPYYNMKIYSSLNPPEYDLSKVTMPIKLFWSKNDLLSSEKDVDTLRDKLPNKPDSYLIPDPDFNHLDYLWAIDAPRLLNDEVLRSLDRAMEV